MIQSSGGSVTFNPMLRHNPIEDLVGGRAERNSVRVEVVSTLQQNPASIALAKRRRIVIAGSVVEAALEAGFVDFETGEFRIFRTNNLTENRWGVLTE